MRKRLGEILMEAGRITESDLKRVLDEQKKYGEKFGEVVVKLGLLSEKEIVEIVSKQQNIPIITLDDKEIPHEIVTLLPEEIIKRFRVLPVMRRFNVLQLAMVDPLDINAIDEISKMVRMEIVPTVTTEAEMKRALEKYFSMKTLVEETLEKMSGPESLAIEREQDFDREEVGISVSMTEQEPVVRFVNSILVQAIADGVSDIHIEPLDKRMRIRMRIDGKLREVPSPEKRMYLAIVSRIKILAGMDIAKTRVPQDGRFNIREGSKEVGIRASTFPTIHGEKMVLRLLDKSASLYGIDKLGLLAHDKERLKKVLTMPYGFLLSTGPTGSGKTTTLYAILNYINSIEKNIITVEDPVEYTLEGLAQAQVNVKAGLTFETGLRSILRQDPDVIMVGEIRDRETASIAVHSALTGHVVLSTLHTNDASGAVSRMIEMGIEPFLVTSSITCVIGQRLLRKICEDCKEPYIPPKTILENCNLQEGTTLYRGKGCSSCRGTGYRGRTGVFEVLIVDDRIKELVIRNEPAEIIRKVAVENGMTLMYQDAIEKALAGATTLEEAMSVTRME